MNQTQIHNAYSGDSTELIYLRARQYAPGIGRFLTRDLWAGNYNSPLSLNKWVYVNNNPINLLDPSGYCEASDTQCWEKIEEIETKYTNVRIDAGMWWILGFIPCGKFGLTTWKTEQLQSVEDALEVMDIGIGYLGGDFEALVGRVKIRRKVGSDASNVPTKGVINLTDGWATDVGWSRIKTVVHEMGHVITHNQPKTMTYFMTELGNKCEDGIKKAGIPYCNNAQEGTGTYYPGQPDAGVPWDISDGNNIHPVPGTHMPSSYAETGNWEDYAETFTTIVYEAYINSNPASTFYEDAAFYNNSRFKDIGRRRDVMTAILNGTWKGSKP